MTEEERKEKKKQYLSITKVSDYKNISTDTLRYYDKVNLFKPDYIDPENGRRYYSPEQCDTLSTILELREMGIPILQIQEYLENRSIRKSEMILRTQLRLLREEIEEKIRLKKVLEDKLKYVEKVMNQSVELEEPFIREMPDRFAFEGRRLAVTSAEVAIEYMEMEKKYGEPSPIFASNRMAMEIPLELHGNLHEEEIRPIIFCEKENEPPELQRIEIEGGTYICIYLNDDKGNLENEIDKIKDTAKEHGFILSKHGYLIYLIDLTLTDDPKERLIEMQFKVQSLQMKEARQ